MATSPAAGVMATAKTMLFFFAVVVMLFIGLSMLLKASDITRKKKGIGRIVTRILGGLYIIAAVTALVLPQYAIAPALVAVFGSIALGFALRKQVKFAIGERETILLFLLPAFVGIAIVYYYPIVQTLIYSLFELKHTAKWLEAPFVGLQNFSKVFQTKNFRGALGFTLYFTVVSVFLTFWIGLGMAMLTFQVPRKLAGLLRTLIVIPWAIPLIINASMWRWILHADVGLGAILAQFGLTETAPLFLSNPTLAVHSVILADVWKSSSVVAIFLMGALAMIPQDIYDAAKVDGARGFFRFRRITLPMILPTVLIVLLFRGMNALRTFDLVFGLTGGGPGTVTETLSTFAYKYYFSYSRFGLGSAYAVVIFLLIAVLAVFYVNRIRHNLRFRI